MPASHNLARSAPLRLTHTRSRDVRLWCVFGCVRQLLLFFKFIGSQVSREVRINGNVLQGAVPATAREKRSRFRSWQCVKIVVATALAMAVGPKWGQKAGKCGK